MLSYFIILLILLPTNVIASDCCSSCINFLTRRNNVAQDHAYKLIIVDALIDENQSIKDTSIPTAYPVDNNRIAVAKPKNDYSITRARINTRTGMQTYHQPYGHSITLPITRNLHDEYPTDSQSLIEFITCSIYLMPRR